MSLPRRWPPALAAGARVALIAPAGPLRGEEDVARGVANARAMGWEPVVGAHVLRREGYLAGHDGERLADLNAALADDAVDGIWCLRGGYGAMRLLPALDGAALARRPKALIGFSDITALHAALGERAGLVTFHGPVARGALPERSACSLRAAVAEQANGCGHAADARVLRAGQAHGVLAGGNLALLAALAGTPYAPRLDGAILVLEDVNEAVYRVDRMLRQLVLAGMLRGCRALVFGQCTDCPAERDDGARTLDEVLAELADELGVPCLAGVPVGHVDEQWTVPLGATATLDAAARRLDVEPAPVAAAAPGARGGARRHHSPQHEPLPEERMAIKSGTDMVNEAKQRVREVTAREAQPLQAQGDVAFLDVREPNEWNLGHIPGAVHIPRGTLETTIEQRLPRDRQIVLYCASGNRSALAADTLQQMGYENVASMAGGWRDWVQSGGAVEG